MSAASDDVPAREAVARAMGEADARATWFYDREGARVVVVRDGVCDDDEFDADQVENDELRFEVVPPLLRGDEHAWLDDFIVETGEKRLAKALDTRQGAIPRALKRIEQADPALVVAWRAFRRERLQELADEWLESLA